MKSKTPAPEGHHINDASFRVKPASDGQIHIRCELALTPTPADLIYILAPAQAKQLAKQLANAITLLSGEGAED